MKKTSDLSGDMSSVLSAEVTILQLDLERLHFLMTEDQKKGCIGIGKSQIRL
jgi:hypothetical protein